MRKTSPSSLGSGLIRALFGVCLLLFLAGGTPWSAGTVQAQSNKSTQSTEEWKRRERECIAACPRPSLRYQAGEPAARQRERLAQEDRYNACFLRCTREYVRHYPNLGKGQGGDSVKFYRKR
ncbi:MAG: hypothetical protein AB7E32_10825 [Desulfovibrio sp.]